MAAIHDLIGQISDERLRARLAAEWARATRERKFGLVFEDHLPELLPLPQARPRKGDLVAPRGGSLKDLWWARAELDDAAWDDAKRRIVGWLAEAVLKLKASGRFDALAQPVTHVLHKTCWEAQAERDSAEVKVELVVLCRHAESMSAVEDAAERAFNALYDKHKKGVSKLPEAKRRQYDRLRLATAKPADVPWHLPESIDWRRTAGEVAHATHLFVDENGLFACMLAGWELGVLAEELARGDVVGWLLNQPHKPWSCFAARHGGLFGRMQLIRKRKAAGGAEQFVRLEINRLETIQKLLLVNQASQLDALFDGVH